MTDDSSRDDAPELRKILDQMHAEEPSVFDEIENDASSTSLSADEYVPSAVHEQLEIQEQGSDEEQELMEDPASEEINEDISPPQPVFDSEPHMAPVFEQSKQVESEKTLERATSYEPAITVDLSHASMAAEPTFVMPPESLKQDLNQLPVTLDCSLRSIPKTLGEVSQMRAGEIITLGCGLDGPIELKANGRTFATGRLVMVDDQLAVEVIKKLES